MDFLPSGEEIRKHREATGNSLRGSFLMLTRAKINKRLNSSDPLTMEEIREILKIVVNNL